MSLPTCDKDALLLHVLEQLPALCGSSKPRDKL